MLRLFLLLLFVILSCQKEKPATFESISVYFSPNGGAKQAILRQINSAKESIDIAMFAFTSREIGQAVLDAHRRGIKIRIILDQKQAEEKFSRYPIFLQEGIPVKLLPVSGKKFVKGLMHNKFAIVDKQVVITGSYNWTASAEEINYENLLIIKSHELAKRYEEYFDSMWKKAGDGI